MRPYRKDVFELEAAAKARRDRQAFERGEYQADPSKWPCPDGPFCTLGCKSIPCGWCDKPVPVDEDHGQVVYCSTDHERANGYVPDERVS